MQETLEPTTPYPSNTLGFIKEGW